MKTSAVTVLVLLIIFIYGCAQQTEEPQERTNEFSDSVEIPRVEINDFSFNPPTLAIKKGTTVSWTNKDSVKHSATSDDDIFDSGLIPQGDTWIYTFNEAGTFKYHCTPHPSMKGMVIVE